MIIHYDLCVTLLTQLTVEMWVTTTRVTDLVCFYMGMTGSRYRIGAFRDVRFSQQGGGLHYSRLSGDAACAGEPPFAPAQPCGFPGAFHVSILTD